MFNQDKRKEEGLKMREELLTLKEKHLETINTENEYFLVKRQGQQLELDRLDQEIADKRQVVKVKEIKHLREIEILKETFFRSTNEKDNRIEVLQGQIRLLIEKLPEVNLKDININTNRE